MARHYGQSSVMGCGWDWLADIFAQYNLAGWTPFSMSSVPTLASTHALPPSSSPMLVYAAALARACVAVRNLQRCDWGPVVTPRCTLVSQCGACGRCPPALPSLPSSSCSRASRSPRVCSTLPFLRRACTQRKSTLSACRGESSGDCVPVGSATSRRTLPVQRALLCYTTPPVHPSFHSWERRGCACVFHYTTLV